MRKHKGARMLDAERLAACATDPRRTRGRAVAEDESPHRSAHQRDRDRILHSTAFRRLKHKTQVFVAHEGDYYRTRLTHSIEVAQIARSVARSLRLNEDLAEAVALAHDLGHTPFGHVGETTLDTLMKPFGGFDHNAQALRIVTMLERRYARFDGLNLSWETLEGLIKHNGPLRGPGCPPLPFAIEAYDRDHDLALSSQPGIEAQIAAVSDDIAYNNHDLDDGMRAGLFGLDELSGLPLLGDLIRTVDAAHPGLSRGRRSHEVLRRLFAAMVDDLLRTTKAGIARDAPQSADAVRALGHPLAGFSPEMGVAVGAIRAFLTARMYRHYRVNRMMAKASRIIEEIFPLLLDAPGLLPDGWAVRAPEGDRAARARVVADYIAGMTDRFALDEHSRLLDPHAPA